MILGALIGFLLIVAATLWACDGPDDVNWQGFLFAASASSAFGALLGALV